MEESILVSMERRLSKLHQDLREEQQHEHPLSDHYEPSNPENGTKNETTRRKVKEYHTTLAVITGNRPMTFATAMCCDGKNSDETANPPKVDIRINEPIIQKYTLRIDNASNTIRFQDVAPIVVQSQLNLVQEQSQNMQLTAKEGRFKMDALLMEQKKMEEETQKAHQKLGRALLHLDCCETTGDTLDQTIINGAERFASILLQEDSPWNKMYQNLFKYKEKHGDCNIKHALVPCQGSSNQCYIELGCWVKNIRQQVERPPDEPGWLEPYQIISLNRLGFEWQPLENVWVEKYILLKAYMDEHGRGKNPADRSDPLGAWCSKQRAGYKRFQIGIINSMNEEEILLLNGLGFIWDHQSNGWMDGYARLQKYHEINNHCRISKQCGDMVLFRWVVNERRKYRNFIQKKRPAQTKVQWDLLKNIGFFDGFHVNPWIKI